MTRIRLNDGLAIVQNKTKGKQLKLLTTTTLEGSKKNNKEVFSKMVNKQKRIESLSSPCIKRDSFTDYIYECSDKNTC